MKLFRRAISLAAAGLVPAAGRAQATVQAAASTTSTAATSPMATGATTAAAPAAATAAPAFPTMAPTPGIGMPDGRYGLQDQVTQLGQRAADFHNGPLLWMCILISAFVLVLLGYTMFRFRRSANPVPSKNSHNTLIEVIWTVVPVLILVGLAVPSLSLINAQYSPPPTDLTIKVTGNQWYWTYTYPDNGGFEIVSNMLKEKKDVKPGERYRTDADGPPILAADERFVIPQGKTVKFIVTAADVIHSFSVPAFWTKIDAVPGRLNQTWVKVDRPGVYFGQCSQLCGARHGFMPIAVEVLPPAQFAQWVASKGGTMPGAKAPALVAGDGRLPAQATTPVAARPQPTPATPATVGTDQPATTSQAATAQN